MKRAVICVFGTLVFWSLTAGDTFSQTPATAPTTTSAPVLAPGREYPAFGAAISPVQGWDHLQGREPEIIAQWCHIDEKAVSMDGVIAALIEPAAGRKLDEFARSVAEDTSMTLDPEKTQLGGQAAVVLSGNATEKLFHPARAILCQRGNYFYQLISYGESAQDWRGELQAMAENWRWIDFQPADKYLSPLDQIVPTFGGLLTLKAPALIRGYKVLQPDDQAYLAIYDYLLNRPVFTVDMQRMTKDASIRPEEMQQDFARQLDAKLKRDKPLSWQPLSGPVPAFLSESYEVSLTPQKPAATKDAKAKPTITLPAPTGRTIVRNCLAFPTGKDAIIISFGIHAFEPSAQQAYAKCVDEMAATFTSKPPPDKPGK